MEFNIPAKFEPYTPEIMETDGFTKEYVDIMFVLVSGIKHY